MKQYWYLTKGSLGDFGDRVRVFPRRPNNGPYIIEETDLNSTSIFDDNENLIKFFPHETSVSLRTDHNKVNNVHDFIVDELNKLNFERPSTHTRVGNKKKRSYRMMEGEEYEDRKKKTASKPKRKTTKKCKCKK